MGGSGPTFRSEVMGGRNYQIGQSLSCAVASRPYPRITEGSFFSATVSLRSTPPLASSWSPPLPMPRILFSHVRGFSTQSLRDPIRESQKAVSFRRPSRYARPHHSQVRGPPSSDAENFIQPRQRFFYAVASRPYPGIAEAVSFWRPSRYARPHHSQARGPPSSDAEGGTGLEKNCLCIFVIGFTVSESE